MYRLALLALAALIGACSEAPEAQPEPPQVTAVVKEAASAETSAPAPTPRPRFGFNVATIEFRVSGSEVGRQTLHVEDWGHRMLFIDSRHKDADGKPLAYLWQAGKMRTIDHAAQRITIESTMTPALRQLTLHQEGLPALKHREAGVLTVAGQNCTVFKQGEVSSYCHWKGIDLQQQRKDADGKPWQREATSVQVGTGLPEALHELPEHYQRYTPR